MTAREWKKQNAERALAARDWRAEHQKERQEQECEYEAIRTFYRFLQGDVPEGYKVPRFRKLTAKQAFTVIWFLQEACHLLPDSYEMCFNCESIFDSYSEGSYNEKSGRNYCDSCSDLD
jgi:hypothetical protein